MDRIDSNSTGHVLYDNGERSCRCGKCGIRSRDDGRKLMRYSSKESKSPRSKMIDCRMTAVEFCDEMEEELSKASWPSPLVPEGAERNELMDIVLRLADFVKKARGQG